MIYFLIDRFPKLIRENKKKFPFFVVLAWLN